MPWLALTGEISITLQAFRLSVKGCATSAPTTSQTPPHPSF